MLRILLVSVGFRGTKPVSSNDDARSVITFRFYSTGEYSVESLYPFSKRDLEQRSMAEIVFDIDTLQFVVGSSMGEETPKERLKKYLVPVTRGNEPAGKCNPGYIKTVFKTHMEGDDNGPTT